MCVHVPSHFSRIQLFSTTWTVAHQAPLTMEFPRQEYWNDLPFPSPRDLPNPGIKPTSLMCLAFTDEYLQFSSVQFSSVAQSCQTLCNPMGRWVLYH